MSKLEKKFKHRRDSEKTNKNYYNSDESYNEITEIQKQINWNRNSENHWKKITNDTTTTTKKDIGKKKSKEYGVLILILKLEKCNTVSHRKLLLVAVVLKIFIAEFLNENKRNRNKTFLAFSK